MSVKWCLTVVLICISQVTNDACFHVLTGHLYIFCGARSIQILCPLLIGLLSFIVKLEEFFLHAGLWPLFRHMVFRCSLPLPLLTSHFLDGVLGHSKMVHFYEAHTLHLLSFCSLIKVKPSTAIKRKVYIHFTVRGLVYFVVARARFSTSQFHEKNWMGRNAY